MTPSARVQAAIELLDGIILAARDGGAAADTLIARYFKDRRYAGSKDRRAVREHVYAAIRLCAERPASGRAAMLALTEPQPELVELFDGSPHAPAPISAEEERATPGAMPYWLPPHLAEPLKNAAEQAALLERAPLDLRVNALKARTEQVRAHYCDALTIAGLPHALRLTENAPVEQAALWQDGLIEIQDAGSQMIALACAAAPGMTIIDLCAGAGGKTLALGADMAGQGKLIAADTNRDRLSRLPNRAARAGAGFIETRLLDAGREDTVLGQLAGSADVVLVDAPCSGTGTWRRNPEARWRLNKDRLTRLVAEQARILDLAAPLVKPGGRLVYAVCALTQAEGAGQIEAFLARHSGWRAADLAIPAGRKYGEGRLLTPAHDGTDGFFIAALVRI
ncbi:MAG: RsmB/NOP family class I SAM-dependent RNA methyltransferase [Sphingobium sp.]|nr:RsmB/NOP family class I SAM-dependent RNA methyltransferase [Sphingobium sp.]MBP6111207.1 RsmB/NOP family class I SAM-dependent RNA methyltransferase [Sphingobium sp.]MBP8670243.1 RsmB/NOP family class I SAM-dependent RNA methyltransferase [Sphingobium sp.]MBP9156181.1 RsmB/NOP family class I SAM-dependent RNA methyltransferase [Sphingobium sp.]MCC6481302.1 RsmB/NOP family class I SAM-dependent RNA methyltransferase [Sphingomonadaceae bacterium]